MKIKCLVPHLTARSRVVALLLLAVLVLPAAWAQDKDLVRADKGVTRRSALVIGNTAYEFKPLKNPRNDARDMAATLTKLGFDVTVLYDLTLKQMREAANQWADSLDSHTLALVYYSGHGVMNAGQNYLVPTDNAQITRKRDVPELAYPFQKLLDATKEAGCPLRIFILDACRSDPLPKGLKGDDGQSGLVKDRAPSGTFIAYAAGSGETASDNSIGSNGLYTSALLKYMETPGLRIETLFKRVRGVVQRDSQDEQHPDESSQLTGEFCFAGELKSDEDGNVAPAPIPKTAAAASTEYTGRGDEAYGAGKYETAAAFYTLAIDADPKNADAYSSRGAAYGNLKQLDKAISDCSEAIRLKPDYPEAYGNRGAAYFLLKQYDKAITDYIKVVHLKPDYAQAYNNRGVAYNALKQYDKAIIDFTEAIRLKPDDDNAYNNRGFAHYNLKQYDKAITDYTESIRLKPNDVLAYYNRALAYTTLNQNDKAIADFRKYLEMQPDAGKAERVRAFIKRLESQP